MNLLITFFIAFPIALISGAIWWNIDNHLYEYKIDLKSFISIIFSIIFLISGPTSIISPIVYFCESAEYNSFIERYNEYSLFTNEDTKLYILINAELIEWQTIKKKRGNWSAADNEVLNLPLLGYEE